MIYKITIIYVAQNRKPRSNVTSEDVCFLNSESFQCVTPNLINQPPCRLYNATQPFRYPRDQKPNSQIMVQCFIMFI